MSILVSKVCDGHKYRILCDKLINDVIIYRPQYKEGDKWLFYVRTVEGGHDQYQFKDYDKVKQFIEEKIDQEVEDNSSILYVRKALWKKKTPKLSLTSF